MSPSWARQDRSWWVIDAVLVEAGRARSTMEVSNSSLALPRLILREARLSEQMQTALMGVSASPIQSLSDCPKRAMLGTRKSTKPLPLSSCSMSLSEVNVLPVPQAMMSLPRSCERKCRCAALRASRWCSRSCFFSDKASLPSSPSKILLQSTAEWSRS